MNPVFDQIAELQVRRKASIKTRARITNAAGALVRRFLGWRLDLPEKEAAKIVAKAATIMAKAKKTGTVSDPTVAMLLPDILAALQAAELFERREDVIVKDMEHLARALPAYAFAKSVKGLGDLGFAVIVAESGDLTRYETVEKLWKRLGLAPVYGKACSTWRRSGGLTKEDWMDQSPLGPKYSPHRLAQIYGVVTESLAKAQLISKTKTESGRTEAKGPYGAVYVRRYARTEETHADWSPLHRKMDAMRVMTKAMIEDLWVEWRRSKDFVPKTAIEQLPVATHETPREATTLLPDNETTAPLPPAASQLKARKGRRRAIEKLPEKAVIEMPASYLVSAE